MDDLIVIFLVVIAILQAVVNALVVYAVKTQHRTNNLLRNRISYLEDKLSIIIKREVRKS